MSVNAEHKEGPQGAGGDVPADAGDGSDDMDSSTDSVTDALDGGEDLRAELEEVRDRWARAVADYQNLRRRSAEERAELRMQLLAGLVGGYLGVLDDFDLALGSIHEHEELKDHPWVDGVRLVRQKFATLLADSGVTEILVEDEVFDPMRHEAIAYQPGPEGHVVAVVQRGFESGSQVVRPARVVVGNGEPISDEQGDEKNDGVDQG